MLYGPGDRWFHHGCCWNSNGRFLDLALLIMETLTILFGEKTPIYPASDWSLNLFVAGDCFRRGTWRILPQDIELRSRSSTLDESRSICPFHGQLSSTGLTGVTKGVPHGSPWRFKDCRGCILKHFIHFIISGVKDSWSNLAAARFETWSAHIGSHVSKFMLWNPTWWDLLSFQVMHQCCSMVYFTWLVSRRLISHNVKATQNITELYDTWLYIYTITDIYI